MSSNFDRATPDDAGFSRASSSTNNFKDTLPRPLKPATRRFGVGKFGVGLFDSRDDTRYQWTRTLPAAIALVIGVAASAFGFGQNPYCESADGQTTITGFCMPSVNIEGSNAWGDKYNYNFRLLDQLTTNFVLITPGAIAGDVAFFGSTSTIITDPLFHWDNTNKRLALGMRSPLFTLDVTGPTRISSQTIVSGTMTVVGNAFSVGGSNFVVSVGSVAIGTSSLGQLFTVNGSAQFGTASSGFMCWNDSTRYLSVGNNSCAQNLGFTDGMATLVSTSATPSWAVLSIANNNNSSQLFRVQQDGRSGFGVATPTTTVHILGNSLSPSLSANQGIFTIGGTVGTQLQFGSNGNNDQWMQTKATNNGGTSYKILLNPLGGKVTVGTATATYDVFTVAGPGNAGTQIGIDVTDSGRYTELDWMHNGVIRADMYHDEIGRTLNIVNATSGGPVLIGDLGGYGLRVNNSSITVASGGICFSSDGTCQTTAAAGGGGTGNGQYEVLLASSALSSSPVVQFPAISGRSHLRIVVSSLQNGTPGIIAIRFNADTTAARYQSQDSYYSSGGTSGNDTNNGATGSCIFSRNLELAASTNFEGVYEITVAATTAIGHFESNAIHNGDATHAYSSWGGCWYAGVANISRIDAIVSAGAISAGILSVYKVD